MPKQISESELDAIVQIVKNSKDGASLKAISNALTVEMADRTLQRRLASLVQDKVLNVQGQGRGCFYTVVEEEASASSNQGEVGGMKSGAIETKEEKVSKKGGLTFKSTIFALIAVVLINSVAGFNEDELKQGLMIGNHLPIAVYFALFLLVSVWNPMVFRLCKPLIFSKKETAAFFMLVLVGCWSPTSGLYRYFTRTVLTPVYLEPAKATWREMGIREMLPDKLFPANGDIDAAAPDNPQREEGVIPATGDAIYSGFAQGLTITADSILGSFHQMSEVLWAWVSPMKYWSMLFAFFVLTILSLSILLHRQWSKHEQLSYPLANIAFSVIEREDGKMFGKIFHSKLFWGGFSLPAVIHIINVLHNWFINEIPQIPLGADVLWKRVFPVLIESGSWGVEKYSIYFCIVGVVYFVAAEASFTIGISSLCLAFVGAQYYMVTGAPLSESNLDITRFGAYVAYGMMLAWGGRDYYMRIFSKAFTFKRANEGEEDGVLAARFFMLFFVCMVMTLNMMGFDWLIATLFGASHLLMFTIFTRIVCEAGVPLMQPFAGTNVLGGVLSKLLGAAFFGGKPLVFFNWLGSALAEDPRECMMPYVSNALKIGEEFKLKMRKFFFVMIAFLCVGLFVGFIAKNYSSYKYGAQKDGYAWQHAAPRSIEKSMESLRFLRDTGQTEVSNALAGLSKIGLIDPDLESFNYFAVGLVVVLAIFMLRFRFPGFAIHPLLFIVWGVYPIKMTAFSYLVGWAIKVLIVKFGGGKVYQELKPIFLGLIVGELIVAGGAMLVGFIYYWITGLNPVAIGILPG